MAAADADSLVLRNAMADVLARAQRRGRLFNHERRILEILNRMVAINEEAVALQHDPSKIRQVQIGTRLLREANTLREELAQLQPGLTGCSPLTLVT